MSLVKVLRTKRLKVWKKMFMWISGQHMQERQMFLCLTLSLSTLFSISIHFYWLHNKDRRGNQKQSEWNVIAMSHNLWVVTHEQHFQSMWLDGVRLLGIVALDCQLEAEKMLSDRPPQRLSQRSWITDITNLNKTSCSPRYTLHPESVKVRKKTAKYLWLTFPFDITGLTF